MNKKFRGGLTALLGWALGAQVLFAWGTVGHETVALIAQDRLTPKARAALEKLMGPDWDLAAVATWADSILESRPETAPWHYLNMDIHRDQTKYDEPGECPNHDCVVDQILLDEKTLRQTFADRRKKREALKFLVHFMGDLHQPLHCADDEDRGGNRKWFRYYPGGSNRFVWVNLHGFWDNLLELKPSEDPTYLAVKLEKEITPDDEREWAQGTPADWAFESFQIAKTEIYHELPQGPLEQKNRWGKSLPDDYYSGKLRLIVDRQLEKAGVRLAFILNEIFSK